MFRQTRFGFTLVEIILICAISSILLAITGIAWRRAAGNRAMDAAVAEIESALVLARQTAQNKNGAYLTITAPTESGDGKWELRPGQPSDAKSVTAARTIPHAISVSFTPASSSVIHFNTAGGIDVDQTSVDSDGKCTITLSIPSNNRSTDLTIIGATGAVVKTVHT